MLSADVFWSRTKKGQNGCIEWAGCTDRGGYGRVGKRQEPAHRIAYKLTKGEPGELLVCHACDNRRCVNPDHLWLGTHDDNMRDMVEKGRHFRSGQTHCLNGHLFNAENTYLPPDKSGRHCRICIRERVARYHAKKAAII